MRLGYFVPEFPSQTHAFFWREAQAMKDAGAEIRFLSSRRPPDAACPHDFAAEARAATRYIYPPDVTGVMRLAARPRGLVAALSYVAALEETRPAQKARLLGLIPCAADLAAVCAREGVDHVHFHSCADAAHIGAIANLLTGLPYSLTLHGDLPVYGVDHRAKMARAALITAVTEPLAAQIRDATGRSAEVIWMGVDTDRLRPAARLAGAAGPVHAVSISRLNFVKGHRFFLAAMAQAVAEGLDLRYSIAGDGPHRDRLVAEIAQHGLGDRVELLGSIGQDRVTTLLAEADLFALTSVGQGEAAPVAVMEAMACGVPVVCSRIGGTPDMITDDVDGLLVDQEDVAGIHRAVRRLILEEGLAQRLSRSARARAERAFDHRVNAHKLLAAIARSDRADEGRRSSTAPPKSTIEAAST